MKYLLTPKLIVWLRRSILRGILTIFQKKKRSIHRYVSSFLLKNRQNSTKSGRLPLGASSYNLKALLLLLLFTSLLAGCLPAVFVAGATAGGVVISSHRNVETLFQDKAITCKALLKLNSDTHFKQQTHVNVVTFNRVVLLVGEAPTTQLRNRAFELIKDVPDIRRINNAIIVDYPLSLKEQGIDTWITTKVKTTMIAEKDFNSTQIKVITEDCVVYLMGLVTHEQAEIAIDVARQVNGVRKVVTLFEYLRNVPEIMQQTGATN